MSMLFGAFRLLILQRQRIQLHISPSLELRGLAWRGDDRARQRDNDPNNSYRFIVDTSPMMPLCSSQNPLGGSNKYRLAPIIGVLCWKLLLRRGE